MTDDKAKQAIDNRRRSIAIIERERQLALQQLGHALKRLEQQLERQAYLGGDMESAQAAHLGSILGETQAIVDCLGSKALHLAQQIAFRQRAERWAQRSGKAIVGAEQLAPPAILKR